MTKIKEYLFHAWTKDPVHLSRDPQSVNGKLHKGRWRVLKIGATVAANVLSVPQDMIGLATGAVVGLAAGVVGVAKAFFCDEDCKQAFSKMSTKGATAGAIGGTIAGSVLFLPLALASYGLSWLTARKGEISRSHLIINIALRALNKSEAPDLVAPPPASDLVAPPPASNLVAPVRAQVAERSFQDFYNGLSNCVVNKFDDLSPESDWWKDNIQESMVKGEIDDVRFIAIRVVQVDWIDPKTLLPEGHKSYNTPEQTKLRRVVEVSPKGSGDSIFTLVHKAVRHQEFGWVLRQPAPFGAPGIRFRLSGDDEVFDCDRTNFNQLMNLLDGGNYQTYPALDDRLRSVTWKLWSPPP